LYHLCLCVGLKCAKLYACFRWRSCHGSCQQQGTHINWDADRKREGLPPALSPDPREPEPVAAAVQGKTDRRLFGDPSTQLAQSAESVLIAKHRLEHRKTDLELEEVEDWFREREERVRERELAAAEEQSRARQRDEAERQRTAKEQWLASMRSAVLDNVRIIAKDLRLPSALQGQMVAAADDQLKRMDQTYPVGMVQTVIASEIERVLQPWRFDKLKTETVEKAISGLPWGPAEDLNVKAIQCARAPQTGPVLQHQSGSC